MLSGLSLQLPETIRHPAHRAATKAAALALRDRGDHRGSLDRKSGHYASIALGPGAIQEKGRGMSETKPPTIAALARVSRGASYLEEDLASGRYVLEGEDLHCGDCFLVKTIEGKWIGTRIEHCSDGWYLVGIPGATRDLNLIEARRYP
jgi:hypothetical protein